MRWAEISEKCWRRCLFTHAMVCIGLGRWRAGEALELSEPTKSDHPYRAMNCIGKGKDASEAS